MSIAIRARIKSRGYVTAVAVAPAAAPARKRREVAGRSGSTVLRPLW
jgi:hypothetical protein